MNAFVIRNVQSNKIMDVLGTVGPPVIIYPYHYGSHQQWTIQWASNGYTIRSVKDNRYLSIAGPPSTGTALIVTNTPFEWHICNDAANPNTYRIFVPFTDLNCGAINLTEQYEAIKLLNKSASASMTWTFEPVSASGGVLATTY